MSRALAESGKKESTHENTRKTSKAGHEKIENTDRVLCCWAEKANRKEILIKYLI